MFRDSSGFDVSRRSAECECGTPWTLVEKTGMEPRKCCRPEKPSEGAARGGSIVRLPHAGEIRRRAEMRDEKTPRAHASPRVPVWSCSRSCGDTKTTAW